MTANEAQNEEQGTQETTPETLESRADLGHGEGADAAVGGQAEEAAAPVAEAPADAGDQAGPACESDAEAPAAAIEEVQELREQVQELHDQLLRARADFENYRRRTRQEMEDLRNFATRQLLSDLLPVVDNFDRALSAIAGQAEVREGIEMVHRQLLALLAKHGVEAMETVGQAFDPKVHEAVMQEPAGDREVGIVAEELQKGYLLHGRVLRPAMVKVTV
ncbi:MAG: nucleotide exchange factor GrpE [Thermoflavifilum sp.]|nr:nucleotide exchange factor GrpE [Thermoflavifilum sp.]MCL6512937.1 nucleotide exchange factor GrpE [Alicyclobacillus sp.]